MEKLIQYSIICGNDECGWIGFQGKAADGGHPL